jgi:hypothetical protein
MELNDEFRSGTQSGLIICTMTHLLTSLILFYTGAICTCRHFEGDLRVVDGICCSRVLRAKSLRNAALVEVSQDEGLVIGLQVYQYLLKRQGHQQLLR